MTFPTSEQTTPWQIIDYLKTAEDRLLYLNAALAEGDAVLIAAVLDDVITAVGLAEIAQQLNLEPATLKEALSENRQLDFALVLQIITVLKYQLTVTPLVAETKK